MYAYCIINEYSGIIMGWIYDEYMVMWLPEMEYTIERLSISPLPMNISPSPMLVLWWITGHLCWWGGGGWGRRWTWAGSPSKAPSGCSWASCDTLYYIILYYIILYIILLRILYWMGTNIILNRIAVWIVRLFLSELRQNTIILYIIIRQNTIIW